MQTNYSNIFIVLDFFGQPAQIQETNAFYTIKFKNWHFSQIIKNKKPINSEQTPLLL